MNKWENVVNNMARAVKKKKRIICLLVAVDDRTANAQLVSRFKL